MSHRETKDQNDKILEATRRIEALREQLNRISTGSFVQGVNKKANAFLKNLPKKSDVYQSISTFFNQAFETLQEITNIIHGFREHPEESLSALNRVFDRTIKDLNREGGNLSNLITEGKNELECIVSFVIKGFTQLNDVLQSLFQPEPNPEGTKTNFDTVKPNDTNRPVSKPVSKRG